MSVSKRVLYCLAPLSLALITFGFLATQGCSSKTGADASAGRGGRGGRGRGDGGPVPVVVATVMQKDVPVNIDVIGNVEAYSTISVKAQVGGQLTKVSFQEGDYVKKDDALFTIDPRPFQAQLSQAQAQLGQAQANSARDNAALSQAQANLARDTANQKYADTEAGRYHRAIRPRHRLARTNRSDARQCGRVTQTILADKAAIESARAQIGADKAAIANAEAMVENAKVQFDYTAIRSPIDGRTGNLAVKQGNVVAPNTMELMTITEVQPIYVTFSVPEAQLGDDQAIHGASASCRFMPNPRMPGPTAKTGVLTFIDNTVDAIYRHHQAQGHL